jgi:hypothetical protein
MGMAANLLMLVAMIALLRLYADAVAYREYGRQAARAQGGWDDLDLVPAEPEPPPLPDLDLEAELSHQERELVGAGHD